MKILKRLLDLVFRYKSPLSTNQHMRNVLEKGGKS